MKKTFTIFISLIAFWSNLSAQDPQITWQQCYRKTNNFTLGRGCISDQKILLPSSAYLYPGQGYGLEDVLLSVFDTAGIFVSNEVYGGTGVESVSKIVPDGRGNYFILALTSSNDGSISSGNQGGSDIWVLHVDSLGQLLSEKTYGTSDYDFAGDLLPMPDGGYYLVGNIWRKDGDVTLHNGGENIWVARCRADGTILRQFALGDTNNYSCNHVFLNSRGNFVFTGKIDPNNAYSDLLVMETDTLGNKLWQRVYGGWNDDYAVEAEPFKEGYLVLAYVGGPGGHVVGLHGSSDIWLLCVNWEGLLQWQLCMGGTNEEYPANMIVDGVDITVFGNTHSTNGDVFGNHSENGFSDAWVVKVSEIGSIFWQHCFGGSGKELVSFAAESRPGYYTMVTHSFNAYLSGDINCTLLNPTTWLFNFKRCKGGEPGIPAMPMGQDTVNTTASAQLTYTILPPENAWAFDWKLEPQEAGTAEGHGLWAVVDWSQGFKGNATLQARCYNQCGWGEWGAALKVTAHNAIGITEPGQSGIRLWPNPATDQLNIELPATTRLPLTLTLSDPAGRVLISQELYSTQSIVNLKPLSAGLYVCRLASKDLNLTAKIIKRL
jgi:hypothetical protein